MSSSDRNQPSSSIAEKIARLIDAGQTAVLVTLIESAGHIGSKLLVENAGTIIGSLGDESLNAAVIRQAATFLASRHDLQAVGVKEFAPELTQFESAQVLFERLQPEARLVICGAGHVGAALANLACVLGYGSTLIDDRAEFLDRGRFPDHQISLMLAENWFDAVTAAIGNGRGVAVAVVTRGHSEDEACMQAVMNTSPDYVGMIGSKRRTRIVLERLRASGAKESELEKVHAPIGLDIGAVTPEEVALAILAEIVSVRRGGHGSPLSKSRSTK
jgi:xanthine dehydrogenase accessory factor